ncbi:PREDICTED: C4b-binding protein beta chain [Condylura cristata]|uniref:C4b-binding protein beta chain n=1 Tax=Condylura cristata TaxID=143302 RepID=UPI0006432080|nr:PREDICTED: C4b-binding protein beta chain [Condylura cristata]
MAAVEATATAATMAVVNPKSRRWRELFALAVEDPYLGALGTPHIWSGPALRYEPTGPALCPQTSETPPPPRQLVDPHGPPYGLRVAVTFTCDPGYLLVGVALVFCTEEGTWNSPAHHCGEVNCSLLWPLDVMVACEEGYTLQGSPGSQCQADRCWAPRLAICTPRPWGSLSSQRAPGPGLRPPPAHRWLLLGLSPNAGSAKVPTTHLGKQRPP